jgi:hypothetical protein
MEAENDVANRIVKQVHKAKLINVENMEAENDVANRYKSLRDLYLLSLYMT